MNKFIISMRYMFAPILILVAMYGVFIGGPWVWIGFFLLGFAIVLDTILMPLTEGVGVDENGDTNGMPAFQNSVMYTIFAIALLPMLYHNLMKKELAKWDEQEASEGERVIADAMNKQVGYV